MATAGNARKRAMKKAAKDIDAGKTLERIAKDEELRKIAKETQRKHYFTEAKTIEWNLREIDREIEGLRGLTEPLIGKKKLTEDEKVFNIQSKARVASLNYERINLSKRLAELDEKLFGSKDVA